MSISEPPVGGAVIDESGHVWIHETDDVNGWVCYHDSDAPHAEEVTYWTWDRIKRSAIGELECWDLHTH